MHSKNKITIIPILHVQLKIAEIILIHPDLNHYSKHLKGVLISHMTGSRMCKFHTLPAANRILIFQKSIKGAFIWYL